MNLPPMLDYDPKVLERLLRRYLPYAQAQPIIVRMRANHPGLDWAEEAVRAIKDRARFTPRKRVHLPGPDQG